MNGCDRRLQGNILVCVRYNEKDVNILELDPDRTPVFCLTGCVVSNQKKSRKISASNRNLLDNSERVNKTPIRVGKDTCKCVSMGVDDYHQYFVRRGNRPKLE